MYEEIKSRSYINPQSEEIISFTAKMKKDTGSLEEMMNNMFRWFDENIKYGRFKQPYFPLQRNDLEVLSMKEGTCGDYANLIVSVLLNLGIPAKYCYLKRDCYGDEQEHICAAAYVNYRWVLIDAALPYRKWFGYDCPHKEYDLYEPGQFEEMMKKEEDVFYARAFEWGNKKFAGLLYAPWIYDEKVSLTEEGLESVFYLLRFDSKSEWTLWVSYTVYTKYKGFIPVMIRMDRNMKKAIRFSIKEPESLWDNNQWSEEYLPDNIPADMQTEYLEKCYTSLEANLGTVKEILRKLNTPE